MLEQIFSWATLLTIVGLVGFYFAGQKKWWCWYINIGCQALWFTYAIVTEQYAFILASVAYTWVFTRNAIAWTREHREGSRRLDEALRAPTSFRDVHIIPEPSKNKIQREHQNNWADHIEAWDSAVGVEGPTVDSIIQRLRGPVPFGVSENKDG